MVIKNISKRYYFIVILLLMLYFAVEAISLCIFYLHSGEIANLSRFQSVRNSYLQSKITAGEKSNFRIEDGIGTRIVHPYIGFVYDPSTKIRNISVDPIEALPEGQCTVNPFGFVGDPPFPSKSPDKIIIVIVGGSVSNQFNCIASSHLISRIKESPTYSDKEFRIIGLGVGAHHQPQQLMAINYYLSQGGEYDILINIDGFNEAFVPFIMAQNNMHPSYPLFWKQFIGDFNNNEIRLIGQIELLFNLKIFLAKLVNHINFSITSNVVWSLTDQIIDSHISKIRVTLNKATQEKLQNKLFSATGPNADFGNLTDYSINLWARSSMHLAKISHANQAQYYHFLQPNIHVKNSKDFSNKERDIVQNLPIFIPPETTSLITNIYPLLEAKSTKITVVGGNFSNLSMLFKNEKETVYIDASGHLTLLGNRIMAESIANTILKKSEKN